MAVIPGVRPLNPGRCSNSAARETDVYCNPQGPPSARAMMPVPGVVDRAISHGDLESFLAAHRGEQVLGELASSARPWPPEERCGLR
jgi:hypothetical protein